MYALLLTAMLTGPEALAKAYDMAKQADDYKRMCQFAGRLADSYIEIGDARTYRIWKHIEVVDCREYKRNDTRDPTLTK